MKREDGEDEVVLGVEGDASSGKSEERETRQFEKIEKAE